MKRFFTPLLACIFTLLLVLSPALAEQPAGNPPPDLASLSVEDLLKLQSGIGEELYKREQSAVLTAGSYLVGRDIAPGSYLLTPYNSNPDYLGWSWDYAIYRNDRAKAELNQAESAYHEARLLALQKKEAGEEATLPEPVDVSAYRLAQESCTSAMSIRITLEEGQVFEISYWRLLDKTVEVVISKAKGLFMD